MPNTLPFVEFRVNSFSVRQAEQDVDYTDEQIACLRHELATELKRFLWTKYKMRLRSTPEIKIHTLRKGRD